MKKTRYFVLLCSCLFAGNIFSQCNQTIGANTMIVSSNTLIAVGVNDNFANYLVCPGVTLTYRDNSQSDTIYLEPNATLVFDSATSYGYATVYSKATSIFDANNRQYMKNYYEAGAFRYDTLTFTGFNVLCSGITYNYTKLPSGAGCTTSSEEGTNDLLWKIYFDETAKELNVLISAPEEFKCEIFDITGRKIIEKKAISHASIDASGLLQGIYLVKTISGDKSQSKKVFVF